MVNYTWKNAQGNPGLPWVFANFWNGEFSHTKGLLLLKPGVVRGCVNEEVTNINVHEKKWSPRGLHDCNWHIFQRFHVWRIFRSHHLADFCTMGWPVFWPPYAYKFKPSQYTNLISLRTSFVQQKPLVKGSVSRKQRPRLLYIFRKLSL